MQENVGHTDRLLRIGIGASLATMGLLRLRSGRLGPALIFASGALLLESAITRVCPVKSLLGIDTRALGEGSTTTSAPNDALPQSDAPVTIFPKKAQ
ncbi:MAG TPA: DUF2892 domain-containing protein [Polyangiaceae bacterium]|nr:DUF2892 domain-containing protein [Polyangiaceae bacterium]